MGTHPIFESDFDCLTDMSKRAPGSTLTHDNWNDEYQTEEAGTFQRASTSTLKERVIMKARRKAKTQDTSNGASAFAGFGAKFKQEEPKEAGFEIFGSWLSVPWSWLQLRELS